MTTTATLTERYISATIRSLRPEVQDDVRAELEASIADAIDARLDQGEAQADAERAVLTELGDPGILAAGYADRPLHLIGPKYYLVWWRLLKLLLIIVPICAFGGVMLGQLIDGAPTGEIIGTAVVAALGSIVHVGFWVTLVFFVLERTGADTGVKWSVDQLPEPTQSGAGRADAIASIVFLVLGAGAVFWDAFFGFFPTEGAPIALLNPALWPWGITFLLALFVAEALLAVAVYAQRRWTIGTAVVNTALAVVFAAWSLTLLVQGELLNPEFLSYVFTDNGVTDETMRILTVVTGFCLVAFPIWDTVDGWIKTARARRA
ncbi:permease prefix domain 1-containing protein [Microbacterium sp. APC 3901]|uniref:permease prefix domain 1-containing protein n=1 Tax=Microbacterium sp. APC 3901 TaxID=3035192 RepID=UPI0025B59776|nr:permease prefix domain 1-containing protein [Microbacterium sp. APC 3901]MDN3443221.1 permease prefix domain 1-containing protein [Microbacterium sp. APC 3901]